MKTTEKKWLNLFFLLIPGLVLVLTGCHHPSTPVEALAIPDAFEQFFAFTR